MRTRLWIIVAGAACIIGLTVIYIISRSGSDVPDLSDASKDFPRRSSARPDFRTPEASGSGSSGAPAEEPDPGGGSRVESVVEIIGEAVIAIRNSAGDPTSTRDVLSRLRVNLTSLPEEIAAAAIVRFLDSGDDAPTGLPFIVGPEGVMASVPTLRTALLDLLPSLDPEVALENARSIIARRGSPDEYALALRNIAWNDLQGDLREELAASFDQMLSMETWRARPSDGFLEAFDIAVELADPARFEAIASVTREAIASENQPLSRAAFITLDRMTLRNPDLLADTLHREPDWMSFAPRQRASLVSRLDITRPGDSDAFLNYLNNPNLSDDELTYFGKLFPNGNYLTGHRLVTSEENSLTIEQRQRMDREILQKLETLAPRISPRRATTFEAIRERLGRLTSP